MSRSYFKASTTDQLSRSMFLMFWCFCCSCILMASTLNSVSADAGNTGQKGLEDSGSLGNTDPPSAPVGLEEGSPPALPGCSSSVTLAPSVVSMSPSIDLLIPPSPTVAAPPSSSSSIIGGPGSAVPPCAPDVKQPRFPPRSAVCQQCQYFYPKLVECNRIANQTLALDPRFGQGSPSTTTSPGNSTNTTSPGSSKAVVLGGYRLISRSISPFLWMSKRFNLNPGRVTSPLSGSDNKTKSTMATGRSHREDSDNNADQHLDVNRGDNHDRDRDNTDGINFTTLLPFLQCICPDEGLAAARVCITCFQTTDQPDYLRELVEQNVTTSLNAFAQACTDSDDGRYVPGGTARGQQHSAASTSKLDMYRSLLLLVVSLLTIVMNSCLQ